MEKREVYVTRFPEFGRKEDGGRKRAGVEVSGGINKSEGRRCLHNI